MRKISLLSVVFIFYSLTILRAIEGSNYGEELRRATLQRLKNRDLYAAEKASYFSSQIHEQADSINRLSGYFAPKGVPIFNSDKLSQAVQRDTIAREKNLEAIHRGIQNRIETLHLSQIQSLRIILDDSGQLKTYSIPTLHNASMNFKRLTNEANQLEFELHHDLKNRVQANTLRPYWNRNELWGAQAKTLNTLSLYLNGSQKNGVSDMKNSFNHTAMELENIAQSIERTEQSMKENMVQNTILGGIGLATSLILSVPSFGTSLSGWILGAEILNSSLTIGNGIRSQLILDQKGLEGFRSPNEESASLNLQYGQLALSVVPLLSRLPEMIKTMDPYPTSTINQVQNGEDLKVQILGIDSLSWKKTEHILGTLSTINQISEVGGFKQKVMGEEVSALFNGTLGMGNLFLSFITPKISLEEPINVTRKSVILKQYADRIETAFTIASSFPNIRKSLVENKTFPYLFPILRLSQTMTSKILDYELTQKLKESSFSLNEAKRFFNADAITEEQVNHYLSKPENYFSKKSAYETVLFGNQTQMSPYAQQKKTRMGIETNYFTRNLSEDTVRKTQLSNKELALYASFYKVFPSLNTLNKETINPISKENRMDSYTIVSNEELEKIQREDIGPHEKLTPEFVFGNITLQSKNGENFDFQIGLKKENPKPMINYISQDGNKPIPVDIKEKLGVQILEMNQEFYAYQVHLQKGGIQIDPIRPLTEELLPHYFSYQGALGLVFGGEVRLKDGFENFILPEIGTLRNVPTTPLLTVGGGSLRMGENPPLKYSGLYSFNWWKGFHEIFTAATEIRHGSLFIGVGIPYATMDSDFKIKEELKLAKIGFILPTGSGILLEPTHRSESPYSIAYQGLNQKWINLFKNSSQENYLLSDQFSKNLKTNSLTYYFLSAPHLLEGTPVSQNKNHSLSSLARFYEKTDPTHGGLGQLSYSISNSALNLFEYADRGGFHYSSIRNSHDFKGEETVVKWNLPIFKNSWIPFSALYLKNLNSQKNILLFSSWEKNLSLQTYQTYVPLNLDSFYFGSWKNGSVIISKEDNIWGKYESALTLAHKGLGTFFEKVKKNPIQENLSLVNARQIMELNGASMDAQPFIKESYQKLQEISQSFQSIQKTQLLDNAAILQYQLDSRLIGNSLNALHAIVPQLKNWNQFTHDVALNREIFETTLFQMSHKDQLWNRLNGNIELFITSGKNLKVEQTLSMEQFYSNITQNSIYKRLTPSSIEYRRAEVTFQNSPLLFPSALRFALNGVNLEGNEKNNYLKTTLGTFGLIFTGCIPLNGIGENMVNDLASKPYSPTELFLEVGYEITNTTLNLIALGGLKMGTNGFSKNSLNWTLESFKKREPQILKSGILQIGETWMNQTFPNQPSAVKRAEWSLSLIGGTGIGLIPSIKSGTPLEELMLKEGPLLFGREFTGSLSNGLAETGLNALNIKLSPGAKILTSDLGKMGYDRLLLFLRLLQK